FVRFALLHDVILTPFFILAQIPQCALDTQHCSHRSAQDVTEAADELVKRVLASLTYPRRSASSFARSPARAAATRGAKRLKCACVVAKIREMRVDDEGEAAVNTANVRNSSIRASNCPTGLVRMNSSSKGTRVSTSPSDWPTASKRRNHHSLTPPAPNSLAWTSSSTRQHPSSSRRHSTMSPVNSA
ncbi:unnamed protein product, partial [Mycena citricolor]